MLFGPQDLEGTLWLFTFKHTHKENTSTNTHTHSHTWTHLKHTFLLDACLSPTSLKHAQLNPEGPNTTKVPPQRAPTPTRRGSPRALQYHGSWRPATKRKSMLPYRFSYCPYYIHAYIMLHKKIYINIYIYILIWSTYIYHHIIYIYATMCTYILAQYFSITQNKHIHHISHAIGGKQGSFLPRILTARGWSDSLTPTPVAGSKPGLTPSTGLAANSTACKLVMLKDEDPLGVCDTIWMRQKCSVGRIVMQNKPASLKRFWHICIGNHPLSQLSRQTLESGWANN